MFFRLNSGVKQYLKSIILITSILFALSAEAKVCLLFLKPEQTSPHEIALQRIKFPEEGEFYIFERILRIALYEAYEGRDFYTGQPLQFDLMSIDHILPKSLGGPNNVYNYVPTTGEINSKKGSKFNLQNIKDLEYIAEHFAPRVMAHLRLYGAFENREADVAKARIAARKKNPGRHLLMEKARESLIAGPTLFRRRMDIPEPAIQGVLFHFSKQLSLLDEREYSRAIDRKYLQFEIDYKDAPRNVSADLPMAYAMYLSHRRIGAKLEDEVPATKESLFTITEYNYNRKKGKIEVGVEFHPVFAQKMLEAPSSYEAALSYIASFFRTGDITREEYIDWTEKQ